MTVCISTDKLNILLALIELQVSYEAGRYADLNEVIRSKNKF